MAVRKLDKKTGDENLKVAGVLKFRKQLYSQEC